MAITKNLVVTLKDDIAELKDKMFIFRNDVGVEMIIELKDFEYSIDAIGNKNNFSKVSAIFRTPSGKLYSYNDIKVSSGKIRFVFTQDLINVMQEIGEYELQFQLYDKLNNRLTIPSYNFYVKEPLSLPNEAIVGEGTVGFSYVAEDETYLFSIENGYIKTEWEVGDLITKGKLNKIENAIFDVVNVINNMDTTNNNPNLGNQHTHNNMGILNTITADKINQWDNKSDFDGNYNNLINKPPIPTEISDLINDMGYLTSIPSEYVTDSELNSKGYLTEHQDVYWDAIIGKPTTFEPSSHNHSINDISDYPNDLATKDYVDDAINNAKLEGGNTQVDLSTYAKKTDLHDHSNKTILDSITTSKVNQWDNKSNFSGNYNDLTNKPAIPTKTSQLTNDSGFMTSIPNEYITDSELNSKGYLTEHQDISGKVDKVNGYSLVSDTEISRLATLENYNDTEVRELINETNTSLEHMGSQMNEVFTSVSRGKTLIASAITDKGITTSNTDTFETMANNISAISQSSPVYGDIVISTDTININEGGTGTFTVKLKEAPSVNQTVNLYRNNDDVTIDKTSLIFTTSNWNIPQTVNCTVAHDEDYDNETCVITLTSKSVESKTLTINIIDDDKPIINVNTITLNKNIFTMSVNDTDILRATITPIDATNKNIIWNVSNDNCSITPNGLECTVTADKDGTCIVSATTEDGLKVATCTYTIEPTQENTLDIRYFKVERDENQLVMPTNLCEVDTANIGGHNDVVHPSILYFKNGWNGYKYWLAITPYPKTNSQYENPCMLVSNDGDNWTTIGNVPIYPKMSGCVHNSDCHIFMNNDTMYYLNRGATSSSCKIEYFTSTDGVNWSERKLIIDEGEHNYLSPSVCKYNGKYYMFVYDHALTGTDDNDKRITVLEAETIDSEWVKVNSILCPNVPTIWHLEVKIIDGGFVGLIMSGNATGGLLYLVKFDNPMDTIVTGYVGSPIITPRGSTVEVLLYKSTFFKNEKNEIEVYVNSKSSGTLDAFCHWTLNRSKLIKAEVEDFSSSEYTVSKEVDTSSFGTLGSTSLKGITLEYFNYQVKFKVGDMTNNTIVLSAADNTDLIILKLTKTSNTFYYLRSGNNINNIVITYEITSESIFRFIREDGANKLYINDRLVGIIDEKEHQDKYPYHYKIYFGGYNNQPYNISYCETSIKAINCVDLTKANEELQNEINNYSNEPNQYYLFDDFNRANGTLSVSVNGINYETDTTLPIIENNMCRVKSGGHKALFDLGTNNYTIFADLRSAFNNHSIYLRYVDSKNYIAVVLNSYNGRKPSLIEVINGTINYYNYYVFNARTDKYIVKCEVNNDYVILKVNNQLILNHTIVNKLETTKIGFGAMLANCKFDTFIVKK